jgi:flavin reductase (DIM6/NTAB) family NADH-FMN oxidoreductase RutF
MTTAELPAIPSTRLRATMGHFATGVTVVSAEGPDGARFGSTANAVSSVSLQPPLVLVCLRRESLTLGALLDAGCFALNMLDEDQGSLANRFARGSTGSVWSAVQSRRGITGAPLLDCALATIEAAVHDVFNGGDHRIVLGRVLAVEHPEEHVAPLLFYRGSFSRLHPADRDRS